MATKEELIAARDAVWNAVPGFFSKGQAEVVAEAAINAAEQVRLKTMDKLFGPDVTGDFVDRSENL